VSAHAGLHFQHHELQLVSACRATQISYCYTADRTSQRFSRGNVVIIPQDIGSLHNVLPPSPEELEYAVCVLFIGSDTQVSASNLARLGPVLVSKNRVERLIRFLATENEQYKNAHIAFSRENLKRLTDHPKFVGDVV
jgi:hypothetical protein